MSQLFTEQDFAGCIACCWLISGIQRIDYGNDRKAFHKAFEDVLEEYSEKLPQGVEVTFNVIRDPIHEVSETAENFMTYMVIRDLAYRRSDKPGYIYFDPENKAMAARLLEKRSPEIQAIMKEIAEKVLDSVNPMQALKA
jgi:hypothetical protein